MHELCKAIMQCSRGVSWKYTPQEWKNHRLLKAKNLQKDILTGRYRQMRGTPIKIYRPKYREANAPKFRDRVWQRSMCNNGVYDDLAKRLILDNVACQKGKGTDMAIRRICFFLRDFYRKYGGNNGVAEHLDIHHYFQSTPNEEVKEHDREWITEERFLPYLYEIIDNGLDKRPPEEIEADPRGKRGTDLGCQINQLNQVSLLHDIDVEIKKITPYYIRYNDDFLFITRDKATAKQIRELVESRLAKRGLTMTDKSGIQPLKNGVWFIKHRFILTDTGKVVIKLPHKKFSEERKTLRN